MILPLTFFLGTLKFSITTMSTPTATLRARLTARFQELHDLLVRSGIIWQTYQLRRLQRLIRHVRRKYNSRRLLGKGHEGRQVHNAMPRISWGTVFLFLFAMTKRLRARGHELRREQGKDAHLGFRCGGPSSPIGSSRWNEIRSALYRT